MSFAKKFCAKSPFKKSEADKTLVEGAGSATEKIKNPLEGTQQALSMAGNVASSFSKKSCYKKMVPNCIPKGKLKKKKGDPCWDNYVQRGMKKK